METKAQSLKEQWAELKAQQAHLRIRNAAEQLGVTEVELLATQCGETVTRLQPDFKAILKEIESLGWVMALSRNNDMVHERKGVYLNAELDNPHVGLFVGEDIDLRIFFASWASAFAVTEGAGDKVRRSIQFFAKNGEAIHKIYMTEKSNLDALDALVKKYTSEDQSQQEVLTAGPKAPEQELPDSEIDVVNFRNDWVNLQDTHHFFGLLKKYKVTRTQALRLAPEGNYAVKVNSSALRATLEAAAANETPIMVFVGNQGIIQIHTGPVKKLADYDAWYNVLDPDFNLHMREAAIAEAWVVRKPTEDGMVTALECFDQHGEQIIQLFGKRKPGIPEMDSWRTLIAEVESQNKHV